MSKEDAMVIISINLTWFLKTLMQFLDRDNSGTIDMSEFLVGIRVKIEYSSIYILRDNQIKEDRWLLTVLS